MASILIALLTTRECWPNPGLPAWLVKQFMREGDSVKYTNVHDVFPVSAARNLAVREFLKSDREWLLMLDADTLPPVGFLDVLQHPEAAGKEILAGWYRRPNREDDNFVNEKPAPADAPAFIQLDRAGAGALLIRRRVLEAMPPVWFDIKLDPLTGDLRESEDAFFCRRATEAGFTVWGIAAPEFRCQHFVRAAI